MRKYYTHITLIALGLVLYFMANVQRVAIPGAIFDTLQTDLNLNAPLVTNLGAISMYAYAIGLLFCGILADRFGAIKVILCGGLIFSIGSLIFPNTTNVGLLYFSRFLLGLGSASFYLCLIQEAKKCFPDKYFGIVISLMLIVGYLGGVFANAPFVMISNYVDWRTILNVLGIITLVATILFGFCKIILKHVPQNEKVKFSFAPFKEVLSNPLNRNLFFFGCLNYGLFYVIQTVIGVKFLKDFVHMSATHASIIFSTTIVVSGLAGVSMATLSAMWNNRRVIFMKIICIMSSIIFAIISLCIFFKIRTPIIAGLLLLIALGGGMSPLLVPIVHKINRFEIKTTAISIMNCWFFTSVGFFGSIVGGWLQMFKPASNNFGHIIYSDSSYLSIFVIFFLFTLLEMYFVFKLKDV